MITSFKNYTKKKQTDWILGQMVKVNLYRQNHTKKYIHTHSQKEKKEKKKIKQKGATKSINKSTNDNKL